MSVTIVPEHSIGERASIGSLLALLDPLLAGSALVVEGDEIRGQAVFASAGVGEPSSSSRANSSSREAVHFAPQAQLVFANATNNSSLQRLTSPSH
jgi:hypothetical protein